MANLEQLKNELKNLNQVLALDLTNWDPRTKTSIEGKQNAAKVRAEEVRTQIVALISKNSQTLLLDRNYEGTAEIVSSARENPEANIVLDALMIEKKMAKIIFGEKRAPNAAFTMNADILNRMNVMIHEIGNDMDALAMPSIVGKASYYGSVSSRQEIIERMEKMIDDTYGTQLKQLFFADVINGEITNRINRDSVTIVFYNVTAELMPALSGFTGKVNVVSAETLKDVKRERYSVVEVEEQAPEDRPYAVIQATSQTPVEKNKKPYTGAKRGRKTNAQRAEMKTAQENSAVDNKPQTN